MLKDFWGSVLLFQVGVFRQLMNEAFSVWDSKYLTGKFRKICASEFSRPLQGKKKKSETLKKTTFSAGKRQESTERRKESGRHRNSEELCSSAACCGPASSSLQHVQQIPLPQHLQRTAERFCFPAHIILPATKSH